MSDNSNKIPALPNYIIGIGASAGGLEAINEFFDAMPDDTGYAFVVIQHLSAEHKSLMGELLSKHTPMQVFQGDEGMEIKSNCIYLIPNKHNMTVQDGRLHLQNKSVRGLPNSAIDIFFESLAKEKGTHAAAIILSGTGTDGTAGITAIKNNGGIVIVQDPLTAEFDGMPNSAVATGYADLILAPEMMPSELTDFIVESPLIKSFNDLNQQDDAMVTQILSLVKKVTQHDFNHYKRPTLHRRLAKRMVLNNHNSFSDYYQMLEGNDKEVKLLGKEFLINVTKFFRDKEAFDILENKVIPQLIESKDRGGLLKVWTVACSTGEEAYSLAILFLEALERQKRQDIVLKIFATDIDTEALEIAGKAWYPEEAMKDISASRKSKFFVREGEGYKVIPDIRKMIVFAPHNIATNPPYSKLDLLTCRNMLIYMNGELQKSILNIFHFAINEQGYLFLGPSENIGVLKTVMQEVDRKWKIYQCISKVRVLPQERQFPSIGFDRSTFVPSTTGKAKNALNHLPDIFKETLLEEHGYAGIFIDKDFEVKQAIGHFKKFLNFPDGNFNFNLLKLLPPELSIAVGMAVRTAIRDNQRVTVKKVKVTEHKKVRWINIVVKPYIVQKDYLQPFLFIVLDEAAIPAIPIGTPSSTAAYTALERSRLEEVEQELSDTKENLQSLIEEIESANEELQSSNEEIISSNEELQSTNEELQSLNEELHTVNTEHQQKIKELNELNDDLNNYFNNSDFGQVFIDTRLIIRRFSPVATQQINLIESDIGRSIVDISNNFKDLDFINLVKGVIKSELPMEKEAVMSNGKIFLMRINPYFRQDKKVDGVVVTFIDLTEIKQLSTLIEGIFYTSPNGIMALKALRGKQDKIHDFECLAANTEVEKMLHLEAGTGIGKEVSTIFPELPPQRIADFATVVQVGTSLQFSYEDTGEGQWYDAIASKMHDGIIITFANVTEKKKSADLLAKGYHELQLTSSKLTSSNSQLEQSNFDLMQFASVASHDLKEPLRKILVFSNLLKETMQGKLGEKESMYLQKIIHSSDRMQVLIDDVLTLSKLSNNAIPHVPTHLNDLLEKITDDLEITIQEKKANIQVGPLPQLNAISGQIHQLFQNLISNGLKFNESAVPTVTIQQQPLHKKLAQELNISDKDYFMITVTDNGIGFDTKFGDQIFGIFQRLNHVKYEGTGIGLAVCKKIVENHNGFIKAESELGKGTTFYIVLPQSAMIQRSLSD